MARSGAIRLLTESMEGILVVEEDKRRRSEDAAMSGPDDGSAAENVPHVERRLAAILSADVKDYSRLMGDDDVATVETLTAYREAMTNLISQHRGRVVDSPGDNLLAEFSSVVAAVQCSALPDGSLKPRSQKASSRFFSAFRAS